VGLDGRAHRGVRAVKTLCELGDRRLTPEHGAELLPLALDGEADPLSPRGGRTMNVTSLKYRRGSPRILGTAYEENPYPVDVDQLVRRLARPAVAQREPARERDVLLDQLPSGLTITRRRAPTELCGVADGETEGVQYDHAGALRLATGASNTLGNHVRGVPLPAPVLGGHTPRRRASARPLTELVNASWRQIRCPRAARAQPPRGRARSPRAAWSRRSRAPTRPRQR
jgi:hypothetical protein